MLLQSHNISFIKIQIAFVATLMTENEYTITGKIAHFPNYLLQVSSCQLDSAVLQKKNNHFTTRDKHINSPKNKKVKAIISISLYESI